jgi:hypothetical protein
MQSERSGFFKDNQMVRKAAEEYFHGREGYNCAQAVLKAFQASHKISESEIADYKSAGGGRAVGGLCGALFAAKRIVGEEAFDEISKNFERQSGSLKCADIRKAGLLSCKGCVGTAAELVHSGIIRHH